jgi:class 3 adenylate cyclase
VRDLTARSLTALIPRLALRVLESSAVGQVPRKRARAVAALFADIEGCTRLCEDLRPREMNDVIERYFAAYLDVIRRAGGEVTEVLGDGLLGLFEGDRLEVNVRAALGAGLEIQARTLALNGRAGAQHDAITVNIGLNAGAAWVGFTRLRGRSGERWVYAASGPVTNVAARLCALARSGQMLTTKATADLLPGGVNCRALGPQVLKNVTGPVEVVEIRPAEISERCSTGISKIDPRPRCRFSHRAGRTVAGRS